MGLDIRYPIGLLFSILGAILVIFGLVSMGNGPLYERSLGININLVWGVFMLVFGLIMTYFGYTRRHPRPEEK